VVCSDGTWMAPSDIPRADGRRLDGERDGSRSRGPCRPAAVKRQQWWWSRGPPSVAQGRNVASLQRDKRTAKVRHGSQDAANVGAERQPVAEGCIGPPSVAE